MAEQIALIMSLLALRFSTFVGTMKLVGTNSLSEADLWDKITIQELDFLATKNPQRGAYMADDGPQRVVERSHNTKCHFCGELGHLQPACPQRLAGRPRTSFPPTRGILPNGGRNGCHSFGGGRGGRGRPGNQGPCDVCKNPRHTWIQCPRH